MAWLKRSSRPAFNTVITVLLAAGGIEVWLTLGRGDWVRDYQPKVVGLAILAMGVSPIKRGVGRLLNAVRRPSARTAGLTGMIVAGLGAGYLYFTAVRQGFGFFPRIHDEFMYLTQVSLLARGRLWMPPLPLPEFFDSFYILVNPVYASLSWPGTALLMLPGHWLHLPYWLTPLLAAGAVVGLLYRIVAEMFDGALGLLAALLLLGVSAFRWQALTAMSQVPILLAGLSLTWAWLTWRRGRRPGWAWAIGALAAWAAITRPIDAICLALPIAAAMAAELFRDRARKRTEPVSICHLAIALFAGAAPFAAVQLIFNLGVTGSLLRSPFTFYNQRDQPMLAFGFPKFDPARRPVSQLPQKQLFYDQWVVPAAREHTLANAPRQFIRRGAMAFETATAHPLLLVFLPLGLTAMFRRRRWVVWAVLPLFLLLYTAYTLFLPHYALLIAPVIVFMVVGAVDALAQRLPGHPGVAATVIVAIAALTISSLPEFDRWVHDDYIPTPTMNRVAQLPGQVRSPAIVLFRYEPGADLHQEPVFNSDVAWPDDAAIIHAHDLGPARDCELFRYYDSMRREPGRRVYRFDLGDGALTYLGTVAEMAKGDQGSAHQ
jgi:hypothetical protein